jgi:hypothetical protein
MANYSIKVTSWFTRSFLALLLFSAAPACSRPSEPGESASYGRNLAVWSRSIFFRGYAPTSGEALTEENLGEFARTLKENHVNYAYIFSGPYSVDGALPDWTISPRAIASIKQIKNLYPELQILPWVGGIEGRTTQLVDPVWREKALKATRQLVEQLSVDGIHVDFEKIDFAQGRGPAEDVARADSEGRAYAQGVIDFHRELRQQLPQLFVSSVVVSTAPGTVPWKRKHTSQELRELFPLVDQISFLFYDTSIKEPQEFEDAMRIQLEQIRDLKMQMSGKVPQVLLAIGSFINEPELRHYRDLEIESIPNTLQLLKKQLALVKSPLRLIDGLAIYCEWHTEPEEWRQIRENWQ